MAKQIMAKLPEERLKTTRPFQFTAFDFFGPFQVKDIAKGRRKIKCWGLLYSCLASRATAIYACPGYSTADFLATHGKFTATANAMLIMAARLWQGLRSWTGAK